MPAQFLIAAAATSPTLHCSDPAAANYQSIPDGVAAPWLCTYLAYGCGDPLADNFDPDVDVLAASMCMFAGCNDTDAAFLCRRRMRSAIPVAPPTSAASPTPSEPWSLGSEK